MTVILKNIECNSVTLSKSWWPFFLGKWWNSVWPWVSSGIWPAQRLDKVAALIGRVWSGDLQATYSYQLPCINLPPGWPLTVWASWRLFSAIIFFPLTSSCKESQWEDCSSSDSYLHHNFFLQWWRPSSCYDLLPNEGPPEKRLGEERKWKKKSRPSQVSCDPVTNWETHVVEAFDNCKKWMPCPDLVAFSHPLMYACEQEREDMGWDNTWALLLCWMTFRDASEKLCLCSSLLLYCMSSSSMYEHINITKRTQWSSSEPC